MVSRFKTSVIMGSEIWPKITFSLESLQIPDKPLYRPKMSWYAPGKLNRSKKNTRMGPKTPFLADFCHFLVFFAH